MSQRFNVYESDKLIAVVHADNAAQAVLAACTPKPTGTTRSDVLPTQS